MRLCVVIPCYNEGQTIKGLVQKIKKCISDVVVIDDGSTDNTAMEGEKEGAMLIRHEHNLGKGAAIRTGFQYAIDNGYDGVIVMDGDGQHAPDDIPNLVKEAEANPDIDIIVGNRMSNMKNMPILRKITNIAMSWIISVLAKENIPDSQCGFRLLRKKAIENVRLSTQHYDTESEFLLNAIRYGFKVSSLQVSTIYSGEISYIHAFKDTCRFIRLIWRYVCRSGTQ